MAAGPGMPGVGGEEERLIPENPRLLERDDDLRRMGAPLSLTDGKGGLVMIEGSPGIGKTELLDALCTEARRRGFRVLTARGGEVERDFVYGIVHQLFDPVVRNTPDLGDLIEGAAAPAAAILGLNPPDGITQQRPDAQFAAVHGLYWLTSNLAEAAPLLIAVDDAQWADIASLRFLAYLVRRLEDSPVVVALAARYGEDEQRDLLTQAMAPEATVVIEPSPLTPRGVSQVIEAELRKPPSPAFVATSHEVTGGNPFLLRELIRWVASEGLSPNDVAASQLRTTVPQSIGRATLLRLARLPEHARRLASAVAVLGGNAIPSVAGDLAALDEEQTAGAGDLLVKADLLTVTPRLDFIHPVVREAVYAEVPPAERSAAHLRAARLLRALHAPADQIAAHLLATAPSGEEWVVEILRGAASEAVAGGAPDIAASYLRRASEEPLPPGLSAEVLLELGKAESSLGDVGCLRRFASAKELAQDAASRARAALEEARALSVAGDYKKQAVVLNEAAEALRGLDTDLTSDIEAEIISVARLSPGTREWAEKRLSTLSQTAGDDGPAAVVLANLALSSLERGEPAQRIATLAEGALRERSLWSKGNFLEYSYAANCFTWIDELERARAAWDQALHRIAAEGNPTSAVLAYAMRSHARLRAGDVPGAEEDARLAADIVQQYESLQWDAARPYIAAFEADSLMEQDRPVDHLLDHSGEWEKQAAVFMDSRARWRLAEGDFASALEDFLGAGSALDVRGGRDSPGIVPWRSGAALALAGLGKTEEARDLAREELEVAERVGSPRPIGISWRALGLTSEEDGAAVDALRQAVKFLEGSPCRLDLAKALLDLGSTLRRRLRQAKEAREPLRLALDMAERCRAVKVAKQARQELLASGARPRRAAVSGIDALTATERRVAELAATGMTNRQVAQTMFVSMRTVAVHLSHAYQKLQIKGRDELRDKLNSSA